MFLMVTVLHLIWDASSGWAIFFRFSDPWRWWIVTLRKIFRHFFDNCAVQYAFGRFITIMDHWVRRRSLGQQIKYGTFVCGNYIVHCTKHIGLPNQRHLWFASMDFHYFFTTYKQDYWLEITIKFGSLVRSTFEKIIDFSMHNVYWDTLYAFGRFITIMDHWARRRSLGQT